ncbi:MAG: DMT family transporter [Alphaproteobacteria bacterium]|nr:DMT family transporter [Alphaproteobacteria bacterium]
MKRHLDLLIAVVAPLIWGSTYVVTTELLPPNYPVTVAMLRALLAGLVLLVLVRQLPWGVWWGRSVILGILNFSFFFVMLFVAAYRLPGGVAATVGAVQPLIVVALSRLILRSTVHVLSFVAAVAGVFGVALMVLTPQATLDTTGVLASLAGAVSMALGTVLSHHWRPPVSALTFSAWQLTIGGLLLIPVAWLLEPPLPALTLSHITGLLYLSLIGAAFAYVLWLRSLAVLNPPLVASLSFLSPVVAVILGWLLLNQRLTLTQGIGMVVVIGSVWLSRHAQFRSVVRAAAASNRPPQ